MSAVDVTRTQVGIVGAGPAGLVLGHLLHLQGIDTVVLEDRDREYVEGRVRAGVLEQGTVDLLIEMGVGERLEREGLVHHGVELRFGGEGHRIPFDELTGGRGITIYGQQEVVKDLIAARLESGAPLLFEVAPSSEELIYCHHDRGFALHSMRSPELTRLYLQCEPDESIDRWPDERIWEELHTRFACEGWSLEEGPIVERGITPMRSFVAEPMQYGRLFLAGDAVHIVPATGAKGLNLAVADVRVLADAIVAWNRNGNDSGLRAYSNTCLARVWRTQHFAAWMTEMMHRFPDDDGFRSRLQRAQLEYVCFSRAAATTLAENYVGLERVPA